MNHRQQRRHDQLRHRADETRRVLLHRAIAGGEFSQQFEQFHLRERTARLHAAILAHELAQCARHARFGEQAARLSFGQQQPCRDQRTPAKHLRLLVGCLGDLPVEPAGRLVERQQSAPAHRLVGQDQRCMDKPGENAPRACFDLPRRPLRGHRMRVEPHAMHTQRRGLHLRTRTRTGEVAQPCVGMDVPLDQRSLLARSRPEFELCDRQLDPVDTEMPCAQGHPRCAFARQRRVDRRQHPALGRFGQGRGDQPPANPGSVGHPHQPFARAHAGRPDLLRHQRARRGQHFDLGLALFRFGR